MSNLLELIPQKEKDLFSDYVCYTTEIGKNEFIGFDEYLKHWNKSKVTLYHLLDDKLIYTFPVSTEKPKKIIIDEMYRLLRHDFIDYYERMLYHLSERNASFHNVRGDLLKLIKAERLAENVVAIPDPIKINKKDFDAKKGLQIVNGMSAIKAIGKVADFLCSLPKETFDTAFKYGCYWNSRKAEDFTTEENVAYLKELYEDFRIQHSLVLNDKLIKGDMSISIHPMDFVTMSDNNSGWNSCMSWEDNGCYHAGTVEMMNSNNVVCCYLNSSSKEYHFNSKDEDAKWNNKKWRQLFYITPEIICGGCPYPYENDALTLVLLDKIRELAKKNLKYSYIYGPEYYNDMRHIYSGYRMRTNKSWRKYDATKKNIIFDTKMMYNDFLNKNQDNIEEFWCVRNPVKKNTIISVSGKCDCIKCGKDLQVAADRIKYNKNRRENPYLERDFEGYLSYNSRYRSGHVMCLECEEGSKCFYCGTRDAEKLIKSKKYGAVCKKCLEELRECPICHKKHLEVFNEYGKGGNRQFYLQKSKALTEEFLSLSPKERKSLLTSKYFGPLDAFIPNDVRTSFISNNDILCGEENEIEYYKKYLENGGKTIDYYFNLVPICKSCISKYRCTAKKKSYMKADIPDTFSEYYVVFSDFVMGIKKSKITYDHIKNLKLKI